MKRRLGLALTAAGLAVSLLASGCASGLQGDPNTIRYWLWDNAQIPAYQACADAFEEQNPELTIDIQQYGWGDYWTQITTGMISGRAPDVFTNHLLKYPDFASRNQLLALDEYIERDGVDLGIYQEGLTDLWVGQDGQRYGLPKDWDTTALFYNTQMTEDAGITEQEMGDLTWNPQDGGTYEDVIARLTVDRNGVRGDEPGFDKDNVAVYGLGLENSGGGIGQTQWSMYAGATGWRHTNTNPWGDRYNYDDQRFIDTITWWRSLIEKGYMPPMEASSARGGVPMTDVFAAGRSAINTNGSWMINSYTSLPSVEVGIAPTPLGPTGQRSSIFNGLADSITVAARNPEGAWQWVKFLASPQCQNLVAENAVVFPAAQESLSIAEEAFAARGVDTSAFTVHVAEETTYPGPVTGQSIQVDELINAAMDRVMSFRADPQTALPEVNTRINSLFGN